MSNELTGFSSSYYELPEGVRELQDIIEHRQMNFAVGNIFKAAYRMGLKSNTSAVYDLQKIIWFATRELDRLAPASEVEPPHVPTQAPEGWGALDT